MLAYLDFPWKAAEEFIYQCIHDPDEHVFVLAFRICAVFRLERSMGHLRYIVRSASKMLKGLEMNVMAYPVGHAACTICPAEFEILGTDIPEIAERREVEIKTSIDMPLAPIIERARERVAVSIFQGRLTNNFEPETRCKDLTDMVRIEGGESFFGVSEHEASVETFDWWSSAPRVKKNLSTFYIDRFAVTNEEYDRWCYQISELDPEEQKSFQHRGQPRWKKSHVRNTIHDSRFGQSHPVVGIDWYDAWAYATYHGKRLPTENQWEKASRGHLDWKYPWGNDFSESMVHYSLQTYGYRGPGLVHWIRLLANAGTNPPVVTTIDARAPLNVSSYGVVQTLGNCWEFTRTAFFSREDIQPYFADFSPVELMATRECQVVIRGGAWSSHPDLLGSAYRGYDLLTDRHTEIGFRCVVEIDS